MRFFYILKYILIVNFLAASFAQAMDNTNAIKFRGQVIDGPFKDQVVNGFCKRNSLGDQYKQKTRCVMTMRGGYKIVDAKASLQVVGADRALRIVMGPTMAGSQAKGNHKISAFQVTTFYDRKITLFDFPKVFSAVDMSIGGVSVAGAGRSTTNPDCLIWDIAGD